MKLKAKLFIRHVSVLFLLALAAAAVSCHWNDISDRDDDDSTSISGLSFGKTSLSLKVGSMDYITIKVNPAGSQKDCEFKWQYDSKIISCDTGSNFGVTIAAVSEGQTSLRCSYGGYDATCIVTVSGYEEGYGTTTEPYIYSNTTILQTSPGVTERVSVSLYGGDASDIDGYTWTVDNPSVASIQPTGQYCMITARDSGYTRIKVTHTKAAYPYYIGVYVFEDATNVAYITTGDNILTMNRDDGERRISVSLVNGREGSSDSQFSWQIAEQDSSECPVSMQHNGSSAVITPKQGGSCTIRVTHPDAPYPLDILCRVITVVKNVYIQPDSTVVRIDGDEVKTVTSRLENAKEGDYSVDDYSYTLDSYGAVEIESSIGDKVMLRGIANGSCKLVISHPKSEYSREVLLIVTGQLRDAVDASRYITTSQNYIRTKVGADTTHLSVSLKGGEDGDERDFVWSVRSSADDGVSEVIRLETTDGTSVHSRAAALTYAYGSAHIMPVAEGTAVITVSHPKIVYPTEILVKVLGRDAVLEEQLYFTGSGLLRILNGESAECRVELKGTGKSPSDDSRIRWSSDDSRLSVTGSGASATVSAPPQGAGSTMSHVIASHSKADADKSVLVMTADDEETLMSMKALYSDKLYYNIETGTEATVMCSAVGFSGDDEESKYDFSQFSWTVKDPSVISAKRSSSSPLVCTVKGLRAGSTKLTGSIDGCSCEFTVTVYPAGAVQEPEVYLTTTQNVVSLPAAGKSASVSVNAVNLKSSKYSGITWNCDNKNVASIAANGTRATVTAVSEGEAVITASHPDSQNELKIYVRVGSEYVIPDADPVVYISAPDIVTMLRDDPAQKIQAVLVNGREGTEGGFSFSSGNESVARITAQSASGTAYIKPVGSGQAEITVSHPSSAFTKKVLAVVGNSAEELAGFTYLTTGSNVVAVGEGGTKTVSVQVRNAENAVIDGYSWISSNPSCIDVAASGATAVLKGNGIGTATITVTNRACQYPLTIIAQCVDPIAAGANPYIQLTSSVMTLTVGSAYASVSAELVGGTEEDLSGFTWNTNDAGIAAVYGQNGIGKIRALSAGTTYITVSHPKAAYPAQILVVCDEAVKSDCYISVPSSIIAMKPTDSSQTITATLINGTTTDKYNFSWSLDVYDIIDFQYSANVCTITPKQSGSATITVSHPKAAYDQKIIVNVQQYATFAFPSESMTVTQGDVKFLPMQVPTTAVATHVEYSVDNQNICSVSGTKSTAQLTAVGTGTTTVRARLVATGTGVEQAASEMLVYVKEKPVNAVYITSSSTIMTVNKGKSQTLSATLTGTGVAASDQQNLKWTTNDSDIVQITGISADGTVKGQSIYVTALKSGEALITCTHEKAASVLQFYVVVPGSAEKAVTLNKSYMTLTKGSSGSTLKATIENSEGSSDYSSLIWTCEGVNGAEVARVMGSGQTVTIYPLAAGEATVTAQLPDSPGIAKCTVIVQAGRSLVFETNSRKVQPFHSKVVKYTVSPADAVLTWTTAQQDDYFEFRDLGCDRDGNGSVEITGIKEGSGTLACVTDGNAKAQIAVRVAWDYEFSLSGSTTFSITPAERKELEYRVSPSDADIRIDSTDISLFDYELTDRGDGTGTISVRPKTESAGNVIISVIATNPNNHDEEIGRKSVTAKFQYGKLTPKVSLVSQDGNFSRFEDNVLVIGDGETVDMKFDVLESKVNGQVRNVAFKPSDASSTVRAVLKSSSGTHQIYGIGDAASDVIEYGFNVTAAYRPTYAGREILDWKTSLGWNYSGYEAHSTRHYGSLGLISRLYSKANYRSHTDGYDSVEAKDGEYKWIMLWWGSQNSKSNNEWSSETKKAPYVGKYFGKVKDASLNGFYSESEFKSVAYWYCPGTNIPGDNDKNDVYVSWRDGDTCYNEYHVYVEPHIITDHVTAVRAPSNDSSVTSYRQVGMLTVEFSHLGKNEISAVTIPVYYEVRKCAKTFSAR